MGELLSRQHTSRCKEGPSLLEAHLYTVQNTSTYQSSRTYAVVVTVSFAPIPFSSLKHERWIRPMPTPLSRS
jgi:hypothetical protein